MPPYLKILFLFIIVSIAACSTKKDVVYTADDAFFREEFLDTLVITDVANSADTIPNRYNASATLYYDILHTKLELSFDWGKQHVLGKASLTLTPYFRPIQQVKLDAVGFDIQQVSMNPEGQPLSYEYDGKALTINLNKSYVKGEKINLQISYTAKPNENEISGSEAIQSDKGLFFIDPLDEDPDVPSQIWTQGETQNNSRWFPTFDRPNERFSQEIILTVDDRYLTLSNGAKISSKKNQDGTRTDHWKQDKPHAPYLAMIAVGDFHEEMDEWNNVPLHYIVEKGFAKHSKKIFNHTPEMLSFFSDKLKYKYPWDKYAQVVVRDFVSGAMENTGAVVFGEFVQKTDRELIDNHNDEIVAHEMMHHWFGDLVTCEDWSNLTLNEGFANYAEYLWLEHKYGKDHADFHRMNEMNGYYYQVFDGGAHPLVHYYYGNREEMFDAHSYNKGGLVLHMLRNYVGDDAFFASLNKYLTDHANTAVEVAELRMAFEDTVGEDLNWFFDQWFLGTGHPYLDVTYTYNDQNKVLLVEVDQTNTPEGFYPLFKFPVDIAIYFADGTVEYHPVMINEKKQRILIEDLKSKPASYVFDGKNVLLAMINENKTTEEYKAQFNFSEHLMDKITAFTSTGESNVDLLDKAFKDKFYNIRMMAIGMISDSLGVEYTNQLQDLAISDPHSEVRREALMKLLENEEFDPLPLCRTMLLTEKAYPVLQVLIEVVAASDPGKSPQIISRFIKEDSDYLTTTLAGIMEEESIENINFMESKAKSISTVQVFDFYEVYQSFLNGKSIPTLERSVELMNAIGSKKDGNMFRKYLAVMTMLKISEDLAERPDANVALQNRIRSMVRNIAANETNPMLIEKYQGLK